MTEETETTTQVSPEMARTASQRARDRALAARWDLNIAIFLFAVLILVIILLFQEVGTVIVALTAVFGLAMVWLVGWRQGKQLYQRFYDEELFKLEEELKKVVKGAVGETIEETIEEQVQKALRERWK
jgi:Flp pilus assembly protein TadB